MRSKDGALAAAYAFGVVCNHPFVDGNKVTGRARTRLLLMLNAVAVRFYAADATRAMLDFAAGTLSEEELADWFRRHLAP